MQAQQNQEPLAAAEGHYFPAPYYNEGDSVFDVISHFPLPEEDGDRAVEVPNSQKPGFSPIFRNKMAADGLITSIHPRLRTLFDVFEHSLEHFPNENFVGLRRYDSATGEVAKEYEYISYTEGVKIISELGSGIQHLLRTKFGYPNPKKDGAVIAIHLPNFYQYPLIDVACQAYSTVNTSLYNTLNDVSMAYILNLTQAPIVFTTKSDVHKFHSLVKHHEVSKLKLVVTIDDLSLTEDHELFAAAHDANVVLYDFKTLCAIGSKHLLPFERPEPQDLFTICFTSGTTGMPKGVELTHAISTAAIANAIPQCGTALKLPISKRHTFAFLPLGHIFQRFVFFIHILAGNAVCFPHNPYDVTSFFDDVRLVKPTDFIVVPRIMNRIEQALKVKFASSTMVNNIIEKKIEALKQGKTYPHFFFDRFVSKKIAKAFGLDVALGLISGSAPVSVDSIYYLRAVFNLPLLQGYGSTETSAAACCSSRDSLKGIGANGVVGPTLELKLRDVPELGYSFEKNRSGEILFRGVSVASTYYKRPDAWAETVDEEGWYKTGDVGRLDDLHHIYIVDRVKNFFKLSQGKFIAAEKIQNDYLASCSFIEQLFIYGDSLKSYLVAVAGLNLEGTIALFNSLNIQYDFSALQKALAIQASNVSKNKKGDDDNSAIAAEEIAKFTKFVNLKDMKKQLLRSLDHSVSGEQLSSFEKIKNAYFAITPFTVDDDTITPTLKIKRPQAKAKFSAQIDALYNQGLLVESSKL